MSQGTSSDNRVVFVVHGRNLQARDDLFTFLRAVGLKPLEWEQALSLTGEGSPYIGNILDKAFEYAQAIVVLLTPDDIAYLRTEYAHSQNDPETTPTPQARQNVLFEAGMAFGRNSSRTIMVELGDIRPFTDVAGRHTIRMDGSIKKRKELANRLETAGCEIDLRGSDWMKDGILKPPSSPGGGLPIGRRLPSAKHNPVRLSADFIRGAKNGMLRISNRGEVEVLDINVELPEGASHQILELPLERLPSGKSAKFPMLRSMGSGPSHFDIPITGRTPDGDEVDQWWTEAQVEYLEGLQAIAAARLLNSEFKGLERTTRRSIVSFKVTSEFNPGIPAALVEPSDMTTIQPPCHWWEPIKVLESWNEPLHCILCGQEFSAG